MSNKIKTSAIPLDQVQLGAEYPIYGIITHILEDTPDSFVCILNYVIKAHFNPDNPVIRNMLKQRIWTVGLFKSVVLNVHFNHNINIDDPVYNSSTIYQIEVDVVQTVFENKRQGPDGEIIYDDPQIVKADGTVEKIKSNEVEENIYKTFGSASESSYKPDSFSLDDIDLYTQDIITTKKFIQDQIKEFRALAQSTGTSSDSMIASIESKMLGYNESLNKLEEIFSEIKIAVLDNDIVKRNHLLNKLKAMKDFILQDISTLPFQYNLDKNIR